MSLLGSLFDPSGLTPHGFCLTWAPGLIWLHAGSDALILLSYLSIPVSLIWLIRRRRDRSYRWIAYLFVMFIVACAITHGLAVLTLWVPAYGIEGLAKAVTALASIATASALWIMAPRLARMLSPVELTGLNAELAYTVAKQETTLREMFEIEQTLRHSNSVLDRNLARHAAELRIANVQLLDLFAERDATREALTKSEAEYRASFEAAIIGKVQMEPISGRLLRVNSAFAGILGYDAKELVGREIWDFTDPADRAGARDEFSRLLTGKIDVWVAEKRFIRRDGVPIGVHISATVIIDPPLGLPRLAVAEIEDADLRRASQAALLVTEARLHLALECAHFGVWELDIRNDLFRGDRRYAAMTGGALPAETWLAMSTTYQAEWIKHIHPDDLAHRDAQLRALVTGDDKMVRMEYRVRRADGGWSVLLHRCAVVERDPTNGVPVRAVGVVADVTERATALTEASREKASLEREMEKRSAVLAHRQLLLREVYHRMNETIQIVDRLFAVQAQQLSDREALAALTTQRSRVYALGFAHCALMTSVAVETFDIEPFLHDLCDAVLANATDPGIGWRVEPSGMKMTLDHAIPLGLLVTEILMNCLRHASTKENRRITLMLQHGVDAEMTLRISDESTDLETPALSASFRAALETRLVRDLLAQLGGQLNICSDGGLELKVTMLQRPA